MENEPIYKPAEVAEILAVSPRTVETLLKNNEIEYFRVGNRRRIKASALQAYINKNTEKGEIKNDEQEPDR